MFKNKHIIVAMLVAPILALISYFSVDAVVAEKPHAAEAGAQYSLVEKSNCRYSSGTCHLKNGEFELHVSGEWLDQAHLELTITSQHPLNGIVAAHVNPQDLEQPMQLAAANQDQTQWKMLLEQPSIANSRIRVVASANEALYFGDASLAFVEYDTSFHKDFRQN